MTPTLEAANAAMREAVRDRLEATPKDDPKMKGYVSQGETKPISLVTETEVSQHDPYSEWVPAFQAQPNVHPTSQAYFNLLDQMKALHASKSRDYGSENDPLANIRNGAEFVGIEAWEGAMVRLSDKVTRLATFNRTGSLHHEGVEDTLLDLASYSLLALLLYREDRCGR